MTDCMDFNLFTKHIREFRQSVEIDKQKDKPLRYNVWGTTSQHIKDLFSVGRSDVLPNDNNSRHIFTKLDNALRRIGESTEEATDFINDVIGDEHNIEFSIAMHELMESVKGESDKARNNGIEISKISPDGILPALPLSRVAASIGRKIAYQKGYRFKSPDINPNTAAEIEQLYYAIGKLALQGLEEKGYVNLHKGLDTIKDYVTEAEMKKEFPNTDKTTKDVLSVSLNADKLGVKGGTPEADYFLNRTAADVDNTQLGTIADIMRAVRYVTQPSTLVLPDVSPDVSGQVLAEKDTFVLDSKTESARQKLYETPTYVHKSLHGFMSLLNAEVNKTGKPASKILTERVGRANGAIASLFGLKRSDDFSIDKKESVSGQNLSKTTPLDDIADFYDALTAESGDASELHMQMRGGRNARLYYENSVLNPHASKQSRYMISGGEYTVASGSADYDYLVYGIGQALSKNLTYDELVAGGNANLEGALKLYSEFESATTLKNKLIKLRTLPSHFPGVDYVTLLTTLRAVQDIRNPVNGNITTEFMVSADATASGGTLTFLQALGTDPEIDNFMERIGLFKSSNSLAEPALADLYGLMSEAIVNFVDSGTEQGNVKQLLQDTLDLLFNEGKNVRELSKDPTMTFVYGQGRKGAVQTMSRSLADRIIDNLDDPKTRMYLSRLLGDTKYRKASSSELRDTRGLYDSIVNQLVEEGLPGQLYDLMDVAITEKYLEGFKERSKQVFNLVKKLPADTKVKILPAGAVLDGKKASNKGDLKNYGMPITKLFEVSSPVRNGDDTVLTRKEKLMKTVMDVSTIHGIDSAQLYHSLDNVMGDHGVVVVHDDVRSDVKTVRAMEAEYAAMTQRAISEYDVHQQVMESIAHYDPEIAQSPEYVALKEQIDTEVAQKQSLMKTRFNKDTNALIGDGTAFQDFKGKAQPKQQEAKAKPALIEQFAEESPDLIGRFMNIVGRSRIKTGDKNEFIPGDDTIILSGTDQGRGAGKQLDMRKTADRQKQKELLEHEIVHAGTVAYIRKALNPVDKTVDPVSRKDMAYFEKAIEQLGRAVDRMTPEQLQELSLETYDRIVYIRSRASTEAMLGEFVAIMSTEPQTAADIYGVLSGSRTLKDRIDQFVARVQQFIRDLTDADFKKEIDIDLLYGSLQRTLNNGLSDRETKADEVQSYLRAYNEQYGAGPAPAVRKASVEYLNYAVSSMLTSRLERKGKTLVGNLDTVMRSRFPKYTDVANKLRGIYDGSEHLQQLMHTITGNDIDKLKKADILASFAKVTSEHTETMNQQLGNFHTLMKGMSAEETTAANDFINKMPLHDYFILAPEMKTGGRIDAEVERLERELRRKQPGAIRDVEDLVNWQVHDNMTGKIYNLDARYPLEGSKFGADVRKLLALKSIQAIGTKKFEKFLQNEELVDLIKDHSVANRLSVMNNAGSTQLRDSMVPEYYKEPFQLKAIELEDFPMYQYGENTGWKVLRAPTKGSLGVVYKPTIDSTDIAGAFTDIKLSSTDIDVSGRKANYPGVMQTKNGYKLVLSNKEKQELGLLEDFSQGLVRGTTHSMAIQDSQLIRDALLKGDSYMVIKDPKGNDLKDIVQSDNLDNPWFVKLAPDQDFNSLPAAVKAKYMPVGRRASNVKKFNENVDLVRKDISHWLLGGSAKSLFNHPQMKWATRIVKGLISGAKIGMVVLNPVKIAKDNVSNLTYLGMMGVDPRFAAKNYHEISKDYSDYQELQRQIIQLKVKAVANPESVKVKKQIKTLQDRIKKNPVGNLGEKGFINSLGSDLVTRNADTLAGFQADMHTALEYMLTDSKGNRNVVAHFIMQLQNLGFRGEDYLQYIGNIAGRFKSGKGMQRELDQVVDRLREIRTEGDVINYVSQYTTSPGSEAVRIGAGMTDLTDVLAKETLYRHLVENENMSPDNAKIKVLDSFPDYKENMPLAVKQLSDMGIIMFPSFWLRIQKVIYRLGRDKPVNLATEIMIQEALDSDINTILDANIVNKANTFGGLLHTPMEPIGVGSILPTHIF